MGMVAGRVPRTFTAVLSQPPHAPPFCHQDALLEGLADHVDAARAAWGAATEEAERQGGDVLTARAAGADGVADALDRLLFASLTIRGGPLLLPILWLVLPWLRPRALWWPVRAQVWGWGGLRRWWVAVRGRTPVRTQPRRGPG